MLVLASTVLGMVTLLFDNWWHLALGRDGTIWSPPHLLLLLVALLAVTGALLDRQRFGLTKVWVIGSSTILLASLSPLLSEYEYGYPHFRTLWWAPALALITGFVLALAQSATLRWSGRFLSRRWRCSVSPWPPTSSRSAPGGVESMAWSPPPWRGCPATSRSRSGTTRSAWSTSLPPVACLRCC